MKAADAHWKRFGELAQEGAHWERRKSFWSGVMAAAGWCAVAHMLVLLVGKYFFEQKFSSWSAFPAPLASAVAYWRWHLAVRRVQQLREASGDTMLRWFAENGKPPSARLEAPN